MLMAGGIVAYTFTREAAAGTPTLAAEMRTPNRKPQSKVDWGDFAGVITRFRREVCLKLS